MAFFISCFFIHCFYFLQTEWRLKFFFLSTFKNNFKTSTLKCYHNKIHEIYICVFFSPHSFSFTVQVQSLALSNISNVPVKKKEKKLTPSKLQLDFRKKKHDTFQMWPSELLEH